MKKVFTDPSVIPCDLLKGYLEASGIPCLIRNERGAASAGVGLPLPIATTTAFAWPEVWVSDEHYEEAARVALAMKNEDGPPCAAWKCPRCGEEVDAGFSSCWNCGNESGTAEGPNDMNA